MKATISFNWYDYSIFRDVKVLLGECVFAKNTGQMLTDVTFGVVHFSLAAIMDEPGTNWKATLETLEVLIAARFGLFSKR